MLRSLYQGIIRFLEWLIIVAMATLVLDVLWGVLSRVLGTFRAWLHHSYDFHAGFLPTGQSSWTEELARFLLVWIGMLGAALAFQRNGHLGMDYFAGKLHPDARRSLRIVVSIAVLFFAATVLCNGGWSLVRKTLDMNQLTPALGIPKGWVYLAVPVSGAFTLLFGTVNLIHCLRGTSPHPESDTDYDSQQEPVPSP